MKIQKLLKSPKKNQIVTYQHMSKSVLTVIDGEIFIFQELKTLFEEKSCLINKNTNTKIVSAKFLEFSFDYGKHFIGNWALCIYDKEKNTPLFKKLFWYKTTLL